MWSRREWASRSGPCCGRRPIPTEIATWTESTGPSAHAVLAHDTEHPCSRHSFCLQRIYTWVSAAEAGINCPVNKILFVAAESRAGDVCRSGAETMRSVPPILFTGAYESLLNKYIRTLKLAVLYMSLYTFNAIFTLGAQPVSH